MLLEPEKDTAGDTGSIIFKKNVDIWVMSSQRPTLHSNLLSCKYRRQRY